MSVNEAKFTREDMEFYIRELAKVYRKLGGKHAQAEIIMVGGASVLMNYNFRETTGDIDAMIVSESMMRDAIRTVRYMYDLRGDWLNDDFRETESYSDKIRQYATYYKTFSNVVRVYTLKAEYLVAMKLVAGREYKKDCSDIVGILREQKANGKPLAFEDINRAVIEMYGSWDAVKQYPKELLEDSLVGDLDKIFEEQVQFEELKRKRLIEFEQKYPGVVTNSNADSVVEAIRKTIE